MNGSMKKNLFFGLMALAGLFTSCSQDDAYAPPTANSNQVSMSIEMPADFVKTRANGIPTAPSGHTLRCILEVWTDDGNTLKVREEKLVTTETTNMSFNFTLADQGDYKAVLWADYISDATTTTSTATIGGLAGVAHYADKYYKTDDATGLKKVTIIESAYTYTADVREAFTAVTPFTKDATAKNDLAATLVRPLTKVTIAEKNATMFNKCNKMTATYTVPSEFNAFTEAVSMTANYNAKYEEAPAGGTISISTASCKILFTDYVFTATDDDGMMSGIELTFTGIGTLHNKSIPTGIPLKRNNWVRAAGNLITSDSDYDPKVAMTVDMTTDWKEHDAQDIPDAFVGDFYYDDETYSTTLDNTKTCIGIVYQVNADGESGKIVGLTQGTSAWSTEQVSTGATNTADGRENMAAIATVIASSGGSKGWDTYPAFKWVAGQNGKNDGGWEDADKWYLPAKDELNALYTAYNKYGKDSFNSKLTDASGTGFASYYWNSTEKNSTDSYYEYFDSGFETSTKKGSTGNNVRCIRQF